MKRIALYLQIIFYMAAGVNHFRNPDVYYRLIPPYLPAHVQLNALVGIAEIICAVLLVFTATRKWGSYAIILLLLALIPAHIYFIQTGSCVPELCVPKWVGWMRLFVFQPLLIAWAYSAGAVKQKAATNTREKL